MIFYLLFIFALLSFLVAFIIRWLTDRRRQRRAYSTGFLMQEPDVSTDISMPQTLLDLDSGAEFGDDEEQLSEVDEELDYDG